MQQQRRDRLTNRRTGLETMSGRSGSHDKGSHAGHGADHPQVVRAHIVETRIALCLLYLYQLARDLTESYTFPGKRYNSWVPA